MIIKNVKVFTEDKTFEPGAIGIENGIFKNNLFDSGEIIEGEGCYAIPGLIDVHFHGCMGYDFCDGTKEAIEKIAEYEASQGVTTIVPATMTLSEEELMKIMANGGTYENKEGAAVLAGRTVYLFEEKGSTGSNTYSQTRRCDVQKASGGSKRIDSSRRYCTGGRGGNGIYQ